LVEKEDVVDRGAALEGMAGVGKSIEGEEMFEESAGADGGFFGEGELLVGWGDGGVGVVGEVEGDVFSAGGGGGGDGSSVVEGCEAFVGLLAAVEEEGAHEEDAADEAPEEDALVTGDHRGAPAAGAGGTDAALWTRHEVMPAAMAWAMRCW
jgi:hypothetical protein